VTHDPPTVEEATNVLRLDSSDEPTPGTDTCGVHPDEDGSRRVGEIYVAYGRVERDEPLRAPDFDPVRQGIVTVGDARSAAASQEPDVSGGVAMDAIADPGDLRRLGVSVSTFLEEWDDLDRVVLCFDSLTDVLDHVDPVAAFRFVHVLTNRLASVDAVAHFHLDPTVHDETVVETFAAIFDRVERVGGPDDSPAIDGTTDEATDEEVLETLESLNDDRGFAVVQPDRPTTATRDAIDEANDEDIARALDN